MAVLTVKKRKAIPTSEFGLPGERKYPMPDRAHAANAKSRATQQVAKGNLSPASAAKIKAKANRVLGGTGVTHDLNSRRLGIGATTQYEASEGPANNRDPRTPYQEDINSWKSRPFTERGKWMNNSQGTGNADESGKGTNYKSQPKFGGTQAGSANKKAVAKTGGTVSPGKNYKGQEKFGGTANPQSKANGTRYANGSSSHDNMRTVIRDH